MIRSKSLSNGIAENPKHMTINVDAHEVAHAAALEGAPEVASVAAHAVQSSETGTNDEIGAARRAVALDPLNADPDPTHAPK